MAFDVTGMAAYVAGKPEVIISDVILKGESFGLLNVQTGIKDTARLIDVAVGDTEVQTGDYSSLNRFSGSTDLLDVNITVKERFVSELYNKSTLNAKVASLALRAGSQPSDLAFEDIIMGLKGAKINNMNELSLWQGDTTLTGTTSAINNLKISNGFIKIARDSNDKVESEIIATGLTAANALANVADMCDTYEQNFPQFIDEVSYLFMSPENFSVWYRTAFALNGAVTKDNISLTPVKEAFVPGRNIVAKSMIGLAGTNDMLLSRAENLTIGVDLENETDSLTFEYHSVLKSHELFGIWKLGAQIARTKEVVINPID